VEACGSGVSALAELRTAAAGLLGVTGAGSACAVETPAEGSGPCLYREKAISSGGCVIRILQTEFLSKSIASAALCESVAKSPDVLRSETTITRTVLPFSRLVMSITEFLGNELVAAL
jgi:hypothetical protein